MATSRHADFITLEHLYIHDHAASKQNVGISTKCPAFGWVARNNRIERVGTGMYFGDSDGSDPFVGGIVEGNRVSQTLGHSLQIKHQKTRPLEHAGRHDTVIRYNVFSRQSALPGPQALPNPRSYRGDNYSDVSASRRGAGRCISSKCYPSSRGVPIVSGWTCGHWRNRLH
ncbi:MAG TPA: hypothetical protein VMV78_11725 [Thiobacillus sp.]|jgi:hypothetical protein|nr:hypothetical protein [Thiobacillus sp.]